MRTLDEILQGQSKVSFITHCALDFKFWFTRVFGYVWEDYYSEWINLVQNNKYVGIQAFTGSGKSELLGIVYPLWLSWFEEGKKFMIISKTLTQSTSVLQRIRDHIENNELLKELIPPNKSENLWCSKTEMKVSTGCYIYCRPYSKNLKGYHVNYILADEVAMYEDPEIFFNILVTRAVANDGTLVAISTPEHIADMMQRILKHPEFATGNYPAELKDKPTSKRFPVEKLEKIRATLGEAAYGREYLCDPNTEVESAIFPPRIINQCYDQGLSFKNKCDKDSICFIGIDLAISDGPRSDYDAYTVVEGKDDKAYLIYGEKHKGFSIEAKVRRIKELFFKYYPQTILIDESNIGYAVIEELRKEGIPVSAESFHSKARSYLIANMRQLMDSERLVLPRKMDETNAFSFTEDLTKELLGFTEEKSSSGNLLYLSKAPHDDCSMSLSLALKGFSEQKGCLDYIAI